MQGLKKVSAELKLEISSSWETNFYFSFFGRMIECICCFKWHTHSFTNSKRVYTFCNHREYNEKKYLWGRDASELTGTVYGLRLG